MAGTLDKEGGARQAAARASGAACAALATRVPAGERTDQRQQHRDSSEPSLSKLLCVCLQACCCCCCAKKYSGSEHANTNRLALEASSAKKREETRRQQRSDEQARVGKLMRQATQGLKRAVTRSKLEVPSCIASSESVSGAV